MKRFIVGCSAAAAASKGAVLLLLCLLGGGPARMLRGADAFSTDDIPVVREYVALEDALAAEYNWYEPDREYGDKEILKHMDRLRTGGAVMQTYNALMRENTVFWILYALRYGNAPWCAAVNDWWYFSIVVKIFRAISTAIKIGKRIPPIKKLAFLLKPFTKLGDGIVKVENFLIKKCEYASKIRQLFEKFTMVLYTVNRVFQLILRPGFYAAHAVLGLSSDIDALFKRWEDESRRRVRGRRRLRIRNANTNSSQSRNPLLDSTSPDDLFSRIDDEMDATDALSIMARELKNDEARSTFRRLLQFHAPTLKGKTFRQVSEEQHAGGVAGRRRLSYVGTFDNDKLDSAITRVEEFNADLGRINATLADYVPIIEQAESFMVEAGEQIKKIYDAVEPVAPTLVVFGRIVDICAGIKCPSALDAVCDIDEILYEAINLALAELGLDTLDDLIDKMLEPITDALGVPDIDDIDVNLPEFLPDNFFEEYVEAHFQLLDGLVGDVRFDPFAAGAYDASGVDDTTWFGGLEFRQASAMGSSAVLVTCPTGKFPLTLHARYQTASCLSELEDLTEKLVQPCDTDSSCDVDASDYVSIACGEEFPFADIEYIPGISFEKLQWFLIMYTCVTTDQLEEMDLLPSLTDTDTGTLSCSITDPIIAVDSLLEADACAETVFEGNNGLYCDLRDSLETPIGGWEKAADFFAHLEESRFALKNSKRNSGDYTVSGRSCSEKSCNLFQTDCSLGSCTLGPVSACYKCDIWVDYTFVDEVQLHNAMKGLLPLNFRCACRGAWSPIQCTNPSRECDSLYSTYTDNFEPSEYGEFEYNMTEYVSQRNNYISREKVRGTCISSLMTTCDGAESKTCEDRDCDRVSVEYACLQEGRDTTEEGSTTTFTTVAFSEADGPLAAAELECSMAGASIYVLEVQSGESFKHKTYDYTDCNGLPECSITPVDIGRGNDEALRVDYECHCDAGYYRKLNSTSGLCDPVEAGSYRSSRMERPGTCAEGTFSVGQASACSECLPGTFAAGIGNTGCVSCNEGEYQDLPEQAECKSCPKHTYTALRQQSSFIECPAGTEAPEENSNLCVAVDYGYYSELGTGSLPCEPGSYASATGSTSCEPCSPGTYSFNYASTQCSLCPVNTYAEGWGNSECTQCEEGTITRTKGQISNSSCFEAEPIDYSDPQYDDYSCQELLMLDITTSNQTEYAEISERRLRQRGNGMCNGGPWNTEQCEYDGGDCCPHTCVVPVYNETQPEAAYLLSCHPITFYCLDPDVAGTPFGSDSCRAEGGSAALVLNNSSTLLNTILNPYGSKTAVAGDGYCDDELNNAANDYDGGDCCWQTCSKNLGVFGQCLGPWPDEQCKIANLTQVEADLEPPSLISQQADFPTGLRLEVSSMPFSQPVSASDNDPCFSGEVTFVEERIDGACTNNYTLVRKWSAVDDAGNNASKEVTIDVYDNVPPPDAGGLYCIEAPTKKKWLALNLFRHEMLGFVSSMDDCGTNGPSDYCDASLTNKFLSCTSSQVITSTDHNKQVDCFYESGQLFLYYDATGNDRVYTVNVQQSDVCGNTFSSIATLIIPRKNLPPTCSDANTVTVLDQFLLCSPKILCAEPKVKSPAKDQPKKNKNKKNKNKEVQMKKRCKVKCRKGKTGKQCIKVCIVNAKCKMKCKQKRRKQKFQCVHICREPYKRNKKKLKAGQKKRRKRNQKALR